MAGIKKNENNIDKFLTSLIEIREKTLDENGKRMSRKKLCDKLSILFDEDITENKLEKIANGKTKLTPELVLVLSEVYNMPELCNEYCSQVCPIGQKYTPKIIIKELPSIVLEMISSLNTIQKNKDDLIDIAADGVITEDEYVQFAKIMDDLDRVSLTVKSLQLWVEKMQSEGIIDQDTMEKFRKNK